MNDIDIGLEATQIAAGIDRFERETNGENGILDGEGLIPLYLGQSLVDERIYTGWAGIESDISGLAARVAALDDTPRKMFLQKLTASLSAATALFQGATISFPDKLTTLVGIPAERIAGDFLDRLADELHTKLDAAGVVGGTVRERVVAWEQTGTLDPDEIPGVYHELMTEAKKRTDERIVPTGDYWMDLNPVRNTHYTARCNFSDRKMDLNVENRFTRAALKHLVAHECFPGHSTQNIFTVAAYERGEAPAEVLLCSLNGIPGVIQEGIGDQGVELIDWIEDVHDDVHATLRRYQSAVATQATWMLNAEGRGEDEVRNYLKDTGALQPARIDGRIGMARHPYRAPFIASYFYGNEAVRRVRRTVAGDAARWDRFVRALYGEAHSPESLCATTNVPYRSYGDSDD